MTLHYTNIKTLAIFGYESLEDAKTFNDDFNNLVEMSDELFQEYRKQKPGHRWSPNGWIEDKALMQELKAQEQAQQLQQKRDDLDIIETKITRLERIKDRTESEQQELDALIEQSTVLFREIKALEAKGEQPK